MNVAHVFLSVEYQLMYKNKDTEEALKKSILDCVFLDLPFWVWGTPEILELTVCVDGGREEESTCTQQSTSRVKRVCIWLASNVIVPMLVKTLVFLDDSVEGLE